MKLRNKKTGVIVDLAEGLLREEDCGSHITLRPVAVIDKNVYEYESLADFVDNWEDYKPKEPLIKDERIRKAVRAWAEMLGTDKARVVYHKEFVQPYSTIYARDGLDEYRLEIPCEIVAENIGYTITELCGEEE